MHNILTAIRAFLLRLLEVDAVPDPLETLSPRDWADLPVTHPATETDGGCAA